MAVFNTSNYVHKMIEDIIQQSYKNFKLFAVDDGSADGSMDILRDFENKDARVIAISKTNGGPGSARNVALDYIKENDLVFDYIWFCDSDDRVEKNALKKTIEAMERTKSDYGLMSVCRFDKKTKSIYRSHIKKETEMSHKDIVCQYFRYGKKWKKEPCSEAFLNNKIFKFDIVKNIRFRTDISRAEDFDYFFRVLPKIRKGILVPDCYYYYRLRKSSLTNSYKKTGDLEVCSSHYYKLSDRTIEEQISIQHKLIRAYYLEICQAYNSKDNAKYKKLINDISNINFKYPYLLGDRKIIFLLKYSKTMLPTFINFRNKTIRTRDTRHFYE